ncbi:MAG: rubrerythrin family protein [Victivallaceae bacterium]
MPDYKNSKTAENLAKAFAGEAQTRSRYNFFATVARREGHPEIAEFFDTAAENEREHARIWLAEIGGIGRTVNNLKSAIEGETLESEEIYIRFAAEALEEGYTTTAALFQRIAEIEKRHRQKFTELLEKLESEHAKPKAPAAMPLPTPSRFMECRYCGHIENTAPGAVCKVCQNENAF